MSYPGIVGGSTRNKKSHLDTLVVENLVLNQQFLSKVSVVGDFTAQSNSFLQGDVYMSGNVYISNASIQEFLNISDTTFFAGPVLLQGNNYLIGNTYLQNYMYLGNGGTQYLYGNPNGPNTPGGLGINNDAPQATLDISGEIIQSLNIFTSASENRNTIAQNNSFKGIVVNTTDTSSNIFFFNDSTIPSRTNGDAAISYVKGNTLQISNNTNQMFIRPDVTSFSKRGYRPDISGITTLIYDISYGSYKNDIYGNTLAPTTSTTGKALWLVSNDNSSNTFAIIGAPNKIGAAIGGGPYPLDTTRSMNTVGLSDISGSYISSINIISGKDPLKYDTTVGINTFQPRTEKYVLDINGPVHIDNGDIRAINSFKSQINGIVSDKSGYSYLYGIKDASKNIIRRYNSITNNWTYFNTTDILGTQAGEYNNPSLIFYINCLYAIDPSKIFVGMNDSSEIRYIIDGSNCKNTNIATQGDPSPIGKLPIENIYVNTRTDLSYNIYLSSGNNLYYSILDAINNNIKYYTKSTFPSNIKSISGIKDTIYIATETDISVNILNPSPIGLSGITMNWDSAGKPGSVSYNSIYAIDSSNIIAAGSNGIISYTNDGTNWSYINPNPATIYKSVYLYDANSAMAFDSSNNLWITLYGLNNWSVISPNYLNPSGKSNILYANNFIGFTLPNPNTVLVAG